jgi:hypothetical protein
MLINVNVFSAAVIHAVGVNGVRVGERVATQEQQNNR